MNPETLSQPTENITPDKVNKLVKEKGEPFLGKELPTDVDLALQFFLGIELKMRELIDNGSTFKMAFAASYHQAKENFANHSDQWSEEDKTKAWGNIKEWMLELQGIN